MLRKIPATIPTAIPVNVPTKIIPINNEITKSAFQPRLAILKMPILCITKANAKKVKKPSVKISITSPYVCVVFGNRVPEKYLLF